MSDTRDTDDLPRAHDPYAAFHVPGLWRYMLGSLLIQVGLGAQSLAIGWDIYARTHDPLALGLVGGVQAIPMFLLSLPAGYLADRFERKRIIAICLCGVAACSLGLAWSGVAHWPIAVMYLLLLGDATFAVIQRPSGAAILPTLVPPDRLENAMKWRTSLNQVSGVAGPALGAALVFLTGGAMAVYLLAAASALVWIGLLFTLPLKPSPGRAGSPTLGSVLAGLTFVWGHKALLAAVSLDMFAVLLGGAGALLPVFAVDILGGGARELGMLAAAPAVGAFVTALVMAHRPPIRKAGPAMLWAVAGFGAAWIVFGLSRNLILSLAMLVLTGMLDNISVVVRHTLIQLLTPDEMRGRVSAVNMVFIGSSNEVGGLESGAVARAFGPVAAVVSGGIGTLAIVALWAGLFPALRRFGALSDAQCLEAPASAQGVRAAPEEAG
jgi:MFS family permease